MKWRDVLLTAGVLLLGTLGPALAQMGTPRLDPPPEEPVARMMTMMDQMRADMRHMQEQMDGMQDKGMSGMGPMRDRMGRMMTMMGDTHRMMEQHRTEMRAQCHAFKGSAPMPKK